MARLPRNSKPRDQLRRRNKPEDWTILPPSGPSGRPPKWPVELGEPDEHEYRLWSKLWHLPIAHWWKEQRLEPFIVARYVRLALTKPESPAVAKAENDLGLTPASLLRMRLVVEHPEPEPEQEEDPYAHLAGASS